MVGTGRDRLLIDTGEGKPSWPSAIKTVLKEEGATIKEVIMTHWHRDHTGGQGDLLRMSPQTKVYKHMPDESQLDIADGKTFVVEGASLRAVFSPGHTQDHMALVLLEEDAMFTGDNILGQGTAVFESLGDYMSSLERMQSAFGGRAYPGHGPVVEDGPGRVQQYLRHRQQREDQVLQVLRSSKSSPGRNDGEAEAWTSMEIVNIVYKDVHESLHAPAEGGVVQILSKLAEEAKVTEDEAGMWRVSSRSAL